MPSTFGKLLRVFNSSSEFFAEAASTGSSLVVAKTPAKIAYSIGLLAGVIEWVTTYNFQGVEIINHTSKRDPLAEGDYDPIEALTQRRKAAYLSLKYGYLAATVAIECCSIVLLYSASKAWIKDLSNGEDKPLTLISRLEMGAIFFYYLTIDLPFMFTNELAQTCKEMRLNFGISADEAPDRALMDKVQNLFSPLGRSNFARKLIRVSGSVGDTLEHIIPLAIIIPPEWILSLFSLPPVLSWGIGTLAALSLIIISGTILTQTYLFEGKYSEDNLKELASPDYPIEADAPWVPPVVAKIFKKALYLGPPVHAIDSCLSILLTLREWGSPAAINYIASSVAFVISYLGNYYSEFLKSVEELEAITDDRDISMGELLQNFTFRRHDIKKPDFEFDPPTELLKLKFAVNS